MKKYLASLAVLLSATMALAQPGTESYPTKPVKIVVPFSAGSYSDTVGRAIVDKLAKRFKQPFIIDNRVGAGGVIGVNAVVKAPADGYTLLLTSSSPLVINPLIDKAVTYDVMKDLDPVAVLSTAALVLVSAPSLPANDLKELIALIKQNPGKYSFASNGNGSYSHMAAELFKHATGVDMVHIPYKGPAAAEIDVIGGQVSVMFDGLTTGNVFVKAGRLKSFGVSSIDKDPVAPQLVPLSKQGIAELKDFEVTSWVGLLAPHGTPPAIVAALNAAIREILSDKEFQKQTLARSLVLVEPTAVSDMPRLIKSESKTWGTLAKAANITLN